MLKHLFTTALVTCAVGVGSSVSAQENQGVVVSRASSEGNFGLSFWSEEKLSETEPLEWYENAPDSPTSLADDGNLGEPGFVAGGPPRNRDSLQAPENNDVDIDNGSQSLAPKSDDDFSLAVRNAHDGYPVDDTYYQNNLPWRAIGKLAFTTAGGNASCTASVISPRDVIVTAAHCCYDLAAGSFNQNFVFAPAYRRGPVGNFIFPFATARVSTGWVNTGQRQFDVCVINLRSNAAGQRVATVTGWLGRSWNFPAEIHQFVHGYPGNLGEGEVLQTCASETFSDPSCNGPAVVHTGCDMTFGSSGGPWIKDFTPKGTSGPVNFVNSVVSGYDACSGTFGGVFNGARFTSQNIVPLCNAAGC
ncbi:MAG: trypsin-like serine peptidase [Geminicoccales bacterium]